MAKKKKAAVRKQPPIKSFSAVIRDCAPEVRATARALRDLVLLELPDAAERFSGGRRPLAMYRTVADVCWIQPQKAHCNLYFTRGTELTDPEAHLQGTSDRFRYAKLRTVADLDQLPLRGWLHESVALNAATTKGGMTFQEVLAVMQRVCLALPHTKETLTWGIPHFRVGEKIFCGCSEDKGSPRIGLKMETFHAEVMMKLPGIEKAPYSRKGDGWVSIDPRRFDDWDEIEKLLVGSYRLIAPKRTVALLDAGHQGGRKRASPSRAGKSSPRSR